MSIAVGAPVTLALAPEMNTLEPQSAHDVVAFCTISLHGWEIFDTTRNHRRRLVREGITWIREHHAADSIEVRAMLAAWLLTRQDRPGDP